MKYLKNMGIFLLCLLGLLLIISGCGGSGGGGNDTETKTAINNGINAFKTAVQNYNVDGMLAFLNEASFTLTISENSASYNKTYATLENELVADEAKQLHWRKPTAEGGHSYVLTMVLGAITYSNLSATGGIATVPFTIKEQADGIGQMVTDTGSIVYEMVKIQGEWLCQKMTINFDSQSASQFSSQEGNSKGITGINTGFGFGKFNLVETQ